VLISMATSSGDDMPRQIGFLIFPSLKLLETSSSTIEQMRLANALCWAKNFADGLPLN
jgi:hypothetical protein